jgi:hypothetical protein
VVEKESISPALVAEKYDIPNANIYHDIDGFVLALIKSRNPNAFVRSIKEFDMVRVYQVGGSRFCERINREHKSNHVMIVVDPIKGVFYQKCMDDECKAYYFKRNRLPFIVGTNK